MSFLNNADDEFQIWEDNNCNLGASSIIFLKMMILMKKKIHCFGIFYKSNDTSTIFQIISQQILGGKLLVVLI